MSHQRRLSPGYNSTRFYTVFAGTNRFLDHLLDEGNFILDFQLVPKFPRFQAPLFPSSLVPKLCLGTHLREALLRDSAREAELPEDA